MLMKPPVTVTGMRREFGPKNKAARSATLIAASMASEPDEPRKTMSRSPGEQAARLCATLAKRLDSLSKPNRKMQKHPNLPCWNSLRKGQTLVEPVKLPAAYRG